MPRISRFLLKSKTFQHALTTNRCVLYVRASTLEQVNSLDAQEQRAIAFAQAKDLVIEKVFVDAGVSAVTHGFRDRPEAKRMLAYLKENAIATILVLRLDRAFRSSLDFSRTTTEGLNEGFHFRFIEPDIDYGTPVGRMFAGMEALRAEMECETREIRVNDAYDSLREKRVARTNRAGYGWRLDKPSDRVARKSGKQLATVVPHPAEQAVLRHISALWESAQKKHGHLTSIATLLNQHGIPTQTPAGTVMRRTIGKGTAREKKIEIVTDGIWKPANVLSVLAHAVFATDEEFPDGLPTFEQAAALLKAPNPAPTGPVRTITGLADF